MTALRCFGWLYNLLFFLFKDGHGDNFNRLFDYSRTLDWLLSLRGSWWVCNVHLLFLIWLFRFGYFNLRFFFLNELTDGNHTQILGGSGSFVNRLLRYISGNLYHLLLEDQVIP